MAKNRIIIVVVLSAAVILAVCIKLSKDFPLAPPVEVPTDIEIVKVEHNSSSEKCNDKEWISDLQTLLANARPTRRQSVNDAPHEDDYYSVTLEIKTTEDSFFAYKDGKKTYIEFPYKGIYQTDEKLLNHIATLFSD